MEEAVQQIAMKGGTPLVVAKDGKALGVIQLKDIVKPGIRDRFERIRAMGMKTIMITGDNQLTAKAIAEEAGVDDFLAEAKPEDKLKLIEGLQHKGKVVAMAGDGINDAPALARADVGIAMGTGADVAMESAGLSLLKGDLRGVVRAVNLARATLRNIKQNLFFAFVYNALGVPIAAGVLYPAFGILLSPIIAAAAMSFSSVSVVGNALRLRNIDLD